MTWIVKYVEDITTFSEGLQHGWLIRIADVISIAKPGFDKRGRFILCIQ